MKQYIEETRTKYEEDDKKLKEYQELNKQENRKTFDQALTKKLTKKLKNLKKLLKLQKNSLIRSMNIQNLNK